MQKKGIVIVVVLAVAAAMGFILQRQTQQHDTEATTTAEVAAATDAPATAEPPKPVIPATLPQFQLADRDGKPRTLGEWKGQPLMVNFWATWCGPCRREIPLLNELRSENTALKLEIIGIAVDFRDDVLDYVKENPISYPLLIGEEDGLAAVQAMGVAEPAFPFTVFADSQQRIVALKMGELHREDAELILGKLADLEAGRLELPAARQQITEGLKDLATQRAAGKAADA